MDSCMRPGTCIFIFRQLAVCLRSILKASIEVQTVNKHSYQSWQQRSNYIHTSIRVNIEAKLCPTIALISIPARPICSA